MPLRKETGTEMDRSTTGKRQMTAWHSIACALFPHVIPGRKAPGKRLSKLTEEHPRSQNTNSEPQK